jgi:hypothetical protein
MGSEKDSDELISQKLREVDIQSIDHKESRSNSK